MHRIARQIVDLDVRGGERAAHELNRRVSSICRGAGVASLEEALAPFDADERYHVIDRLEVDLGEVRLEGLETALTSALSAGVAKALRARRLEPQRDRGSAGPISRSPVAALLDAVLEFLRLGRLPWWYAGSGDPLEARLMAELESDAAAAAPSTGESPSRPAVEFLAELERTLRSSPTARLRLARQFSTRCALALLLRIDAHLQRRALDALEALREQVPRGELVARLEVGLVEAALEAFAVERSGATKATTAELAGAAVLDAHRLTAEERTQVASRLGIEPVEDADTRAEARWAETRKAGRESSDTLFVENAGVVLLHPFLEPCFEALGFAKDGELTNPSRAALLIHHLATGALTAEEHELVFAKLLCGVPLERPLFREPAISAVEQAEATALLEAVVRHWDVLRGTSVD